MNLKLSLEKVRNDLTPLKAYEVVFYGSYAAGSARLQSDIDVAVLTRSSDPAHNRKVFARLLGKVPEKYDVKIFELLPLDVKASLMEQWRGIFGNELEMSEYFYHFRRLWEDCKHRYYENQFASAEEKMKALGMV